jgi:hypothetical protein
MNSIFYIKYDDFTIEEGTNTTQFEFFDNRRDAVLYRHQLLDRVKEDGGDNNILYNGKIYIFESRGVVNLLSALNKLTKIEYGSSLEQEDIRKQKFEHGACFININQK